MKVLLIIDLQNDFCPGGSLAVNEGDQLPAIINALIDSGEYDLVVASADWHPANHVSYARTHSMEPFQAVEIEGVSQMLWPVHCEEGSEGAAFHPKLKTGSIDRVIHKGTDPGTDSYSAFFDNLRKKETELRAFLESEAERRGETPEDIEISVCGLALDYCVLFSALDAVSLGFRTEVLVDACRAVNLNPGDDIRALRQLAEKGVTLRTSIERNLSVERDLRCDLSA